MNFTNKHIVLIIIAIIIIAFIYNYDVYIVQKYQPICKPIYITKKILTTDEEKILNKTENKEQFDMELIEGFENFLSSSSSSSSSEQNLPLHVPGEILGSFTVPGVTDEKKIKVIDSVIKILANIPTNMHDETIKQLIEYFAILYQTANSLEIFYNNVAASTKIKEDPYNSKYAQLILFLIGKFNNDVDYCLDNKINKKCTLQTSNKIDPDCIQNSNLDSESKVSTNSKSNLSNSNNKLPNSLSKLIEKQILKEISNSTEKLPLTTEEVNQLVQKAKSDYLNEINLMEQSQQINQNQNNNNDFDNNNNIINENNNIPQIVKSIYNLPKTMSKIVNKISNSNNKNNQNINLSKNIVNQLDDSMYQNSEYINQKQSKFNYDNQREDNNLYNQFNRSTPCTEKCAIKCSVSNENQNQNQNPNPNSNSNQNIESFNNYIGENEIQSFNHYGSNDYYQPF